MQADTVIYHVGPDEVFGRALSGLLKIYDIAVQSYQDGTEFLGVLSSCESQECCLLLELDESARALLNTVAEADCNCPVIVLAECCDDATRAELLAAGALDLIEKSLVSTYIYTRLGEVVPGAMRMPSTSPSTMELRDGTQVTFRMMHPEDAEIEQEFVTGLSDESRYLRFFSGIKELPPYMLEVLTNPEFPLSYALIATIQEDGREREIGVARYAPTANERVAEFAVTVADEWQGFGIASQLMRGVIAAAAVGGVDRLEGIVLKENVAMLALANRLGFSKTPSSGVGLSVVRVVRDLRETSGIED